MNIKIGDYVRTKNYGIKKVLDIYNENKIELDKKNAFGILGVCESIENIIGNPSNNVLQLIQIGDYINGSRVIKIQNVENYPDLLNVKIEKADFRYGVCETIFEKDIKSILTKEQFESMEYKVGELDEQ